MCGLIGYSRAEVTSIPNGKVFALALAKSIEDRGLDSTGFGWAEKDDHDNVYYSKLAGRASKVADLLPLPGRGIHTLIGHTRHATKGSVSDLNNAHPVVSDHIVAVHNGRISNDDALIELAGLTATRVGAVDSWAVPAVLSADLGATHPTELLELVEGVAAIAWMDSTENDVLHLARLSTRPLTIAWTKRGDLVFASTVGNLRKASLAAKIELVDVTTIKEGTYLRIEQGGIQEWKEFHVNHPKVTTQLDIPGIASGGKPRQAPKQTTKGEQRARRKGKGRDNGQRVMSYAEYMADRDGRPVRTTTADDANLDGFQPWEDAIDWDTIVPRRGHAGYYNT